MTKVLSSVSNSPPVQTQHTVAHHILNQPTSDSLDQGVSVLRCPKLSNESGFDAFLRPAERCPHEVFELMQEHVFPSKIGQQEETYQVE